MINKHLVPSGSVWVTIPASWSLFAGNPHHVTKICRPFDLQITWRTITMQITLFSQNYNKLRILWYNFIPFFLKPTMFECIKPAISVNTRHWPNVDLMLCQRRRCWQNIKSTLGHRLERQTGPRVLFCDPWVVRGQYSERIPIHLGRSRAGN